MELIEVERDAVRQSRQFREKPILRSKMWLFIGLLLWSGCRKSEIEKSPNVILIITDDQGYGDFGFMGNPVIQTPNLDDLASESVILREFYVSPVCAPTRASLMTGRYNYRTRAVTYVGRAMMEPEEITIAELLKDSGYSTGIFGKWHLGDTYPMRPIDQGFDEALVHRGGGIGQPSDPPGGERKYTDPILFHNGQPEQSEGYCTDIYFDRAMKWMKEQHEQDRPFFTYLATNAPHGPFHDVPNDWLETYTRINLDNDQFPQLEGHPLPDETDRDRRARIFAMISNIDENIGRLVNWLESEDLSRETLILFLVDNGPNGRRYVGGMRGSKSDVYEGGIRSPLLIHWPGHLPSEASTNRFAAHIDILPTILDALEVPHPDTLMLDGRSLWPLLIQENPEWPERNLVIQTHRGDAPVRYHHFMIRNDQWKLVHPSGFGRETFSGMPQFELYDLENDPLEMEDVSSVRLDIVDQLKDDYDEWFDDVSSTRPDNYEKPHIVVGSPHEETTVLTRQDWQHVKDRPWGTNSNGFWMLSVTESTSYDVKVIWRPLDEEGALTLSWQDSTETVQVFPNQVEHVFESKYLTAGESQLAAELTSPQKTRGPWHIEIARSR